MTKEFFKVGKKWRCGGWVEFTLNHFGFGITTYNCKNTHNFEFTLPFFHFYISCYTLPSMRG